MPASFCNPMTHADFLDWAAAQPTRHEFDGLNPVAMTGGSGNHARIIRNIVFELTRRLPPDGPCEALASDAGVRTLGEAVRYPDVLVTCTPFDGRDRLVPAPVVVFEVTSPGSLREDRILKPAEYAAVPSIRRYVLVEQSVVGLTVLSRDGAEPWRLQTLKAGDALPLPELGIELPVDALYARVTPDAP